MHGVLNRGPGEQQAIAAFELQQRLPPRARRVLDILRLVKDHVLPGNLLKVLLVLRDELVRRDDDMEVRILVVRDVLLRPELA